MAVLTFFPKTRLSELVGRIGGVSRDDAVEGAMTHLEGMRAEGDAVIESSIAELEAVVRAAIPNGKCSPDQMHEILRLCDQIVTLAGTFGYPTLDVASKSLCDVADGLLRSNRYDISPIQVHVQAMRMASPLSPPLEPAAVEMVLSELGKIITFYGFARVSDTLGNQDV